MRAEATRRAVVLVGNPASPYSRGLRIARTLVEAGFAVTIAAVAADGVPDREVDGDVVIRRFRPSGPFAGMAASHSSTPASAAAPAIAAMPALAAAGGPSRGRLRVSRLLPATFRRALAALRRWAFWPHTVRGWWATLARELEPADLYHACGSLTIAPALAARDRDRRAGRSSRVIYDAIDDVVASNNTLGMPGFVRASIRARESGWARAADGRITVNGSLAASLAARWGTPPPLDLPNWPEASLPLDAPRPDLIRSALHLPGTTRVVVFQGRIGPNLGLDEAAAAVLEVPDATLCVIGFGRGYAASVARDADPRFAGRHATLPAVHPDEVVAWSASADVAIIPLPPVSANQRASTPNKLWEAVAAGTPVVIGPDLPVMAALVRRFDLGVVAASLRPADLAAAIREVLDVEPDAAQARRERIAAIAREHFAWPVAAARYRSLVAELLPDTKAVDPTAADTQAAEPPGAEPPDSRTRDAR